MRGIDVGQRLTPATMRTLRGLGFEVLARYYFDGTDANPKTLTRDEAEAWLGTGGAILPVMEKDPTTLAYFTEPQGRRDAIDALADTLRCWQPSGTPIVFTVDLNYPVAELPRLLDYVNGAVAELAGEHPFWLYAPSAVLRAIIETDPWPGVAGLFRPYAPGWSGGGNAEASALFDAIQTHNGVSVGGVVCDLDLYRTAARLWRA